MTLELVSTEDGSLSIRDEATGELHHNRAGAFEEALVNYVQPSGVLFAPDLCGKDSVLRVLDVCFGLGYNSFVLLAALAQVRPLFKTVHILGIEQDADIVQLIPEILRYNKFRPLTQHVNISEFTAFGEHKFAIGETQVALEIVQGDVRKEVPAMLERESFDHSPGTPRGNGKGAGNHAREWDMIFHDPFSPKRLPELWTIDLFQCYFEMLHARAGKVLTYSAAAAVRGAMKSVGFWVFRSTALGGKSGGTVGSINIRQHASGNPYMFALNEGENAKCSSASGIPYRDETFIASSADIRVRRLVEQVEFHQSRKQK
jgi:tRNA U34 5-methylaminomethyl-2-thiouridine-forming methyltransferase MnmC